MRAMLRSLHGLVLVGVLAALTFGPAPAGAVYAGSPAAPQAAFVVNSTDDDPDATPGNGDCETVTADECTLRAALEEANALPGADAITFSVTGSIPFGSALPAITETVSIDGPGAGDLTLDGTGANPVLQFISNDPNTAFSVSGLTLGDGSALAGGGIQQQGLSSLTISGTVIVENDALNLGGGLYHDGPVTLINSTVWDNRAGSSGGGIFSSGPLEVISSTVIENRIQAFALQSPAGSPTSPAGGGIYALTVLTLTNSSVVSNTISPSFATAQATEPEGCGPFTEGASPSGAIQRGYGIFLDNATALISNSDISFNRQVLVCAGSAPLGVASGPSGGGVYNYLGQVSVLDSTITHNATGLGGGLFNDGGQMQVIDSWVADNFAGYGGGGITQDGGSLNLTNSQVVNNRALGGGGGGLLLGSGLALIQDSDISLNETSASGGGMAVVDAGAEVTILRSLIYQNLAGASPPVAKSVEPQGVTFDVGGGLEISSPAQVTITATAIYSNAAQIGGGIASNGLLLMTDVTLSGNRADLDGGGLVVGGAVGALAALRHVTLAYNIADDDDNGSGSGGGLYVFTATTTLTNTLVAMNLDMGDEAPECGGVPLSGGYNLIQSTGGCTFTTTTGDQADVEGANLLPLGNYGGGTLTHALLPDSLAVNTAGAAGCTPADQRGVPRPVGAGCDIGAFELLFQLFLPLINR